MRSQAELGNETPRIPSRANFHYVMPALQTPPQSLHSFFDVVVAVVRRANQQAIAEFRSSVDRIVMAFVSNG